MNRPLAYPLLAVALLVIGAGLIWALSFEPPYVVSPAVASVDTARIYEAFSVNEPIQPIALPTGLDHAKVVLGERLFHDPRLSLDNSISCVSCHDLTRGGTDHLTYSIGVGGAVGRINALTVFNSAFNFRLFWDGRAETLTEQLDGPLTSPTEMGSSWSEIVDKLRHDDAYVREFALVFSDRAAAPSCGKDSASCRTYVTRETVTAALAEFVRSLATPDGRFDRYLKGDLSAISADEKTGYDLFKSYGCIACHQGANVGGNMFQIFGVMRDYFAERGNVTEVDNGRFNVTGREEDRHRFRVPSLRNVALTAPYFHDGTAQTLDQAVMVMAQYQLGVVMPMEDLELIVKFLGTLTGQYRGEPL